MQRRDSSTRWRPPSLTAGLPLLAAALAAVVGSALLALQPARFQLQQQPLAPHADLLLPVDALGVAHHDFAYVLRAHDVVLERLMYGAKKRVWQTTLSTPVRLTGVLDVTGNGLDALCLTSTGGAEPVAFVLDRAGQRIARLRAPPGAGDEGGANAELVLHLALAQDGRRKLLGSVRRSRGVPVSEILLFDLASGQPDWRVPLATAPSTLVIADLDGDGRSEFVLSTCSSQRPGPSDSGLCSAIAISENGARLWSVPLAVGGAITGVTAIGRSERGAGALVVATSRPAGADSLHGRIALIDGPTGRVLATREVRSGLGRPMAIAGPSPRIAVGSRDGVLRLYDEALEVVAERAFGMPIEVEECADLNRDGRLELIAATPGRVVILDERLRTRAELRFGVPASGVPDVRLASAGFGNPRLVVSGSPALVADVTAIPPLADPMRVPAVAAAAGALRARARGPRLASSCSTTTRSATRPSAASAPSPGCGCGPRPGRQGIRSRRRCWRAHATSTTGSARRRWCASPAAPQSWACRATGCAASRPWRARSRPPSPPPARPRRPGSRIGSRARWPP